MIKNGHAHCDECGKLLGAAEAAAVAGRLVCAKCASILRRTLPDPQPDWIRMNRLAKYRDLAGDLIIANCVLVVVCLVTVVVVFLLTWKFLALVGLLSVVGPLEMIVLLFTAQQVLSEFRTRELRAVGR